MLMMSLLNVIENPNFVKIVKTEPVSGFSFKAHLRDFMSYSGYSAVCQKINSSWVKVRLIHTVVIKCWILLMIVLSTQT